MLKGYRQVPLTQRAREISAFVTPSGLYQYKVMPFGMKNAKLTINLMKSEFGKATVKYLGHIVGRGQVRPLDAKIQTIAKFPIPTQRKELARFLGMAGYYRNFCLNFLEIAAPLTNLLSKKVKFVWTDDCQLAFITPKIPCFEKSRLRETF